MHTIFKDLTEYNPALVYLFKPESSYDNFMHDHTQFLDLKAAYLYAQTHLLPYFRALQPKEADPEPVLFIDMLKTIHGLMTKKLLAEHPEASGAFTPQMVLRWKHGQLLNGEILSFLAGQHECRSESELARHLIKPPFNLSPQVLKPFLQIMLRLKQESSLDSHPWMPASFSSPPHFHLGEKTLSKLALAFYTKNMLSDSEKQKS